MKKVRLPAFALVAFVSGSAVLHAGNPPIAHNASVLAGAAVDGGRFELELEPGTSYRTTTRWLIFPVPVYPQVACWIETPEGLYVETIYVTAKGARKAWMAAPAAGRPEALPVWSHIQARVKAEVDAVSAATPSGTTRRGSAAGKLASGRYVVMLEVNRSYDYDERHTRENSGVVGQPSLLYRAEITVGGEDGRAGFVPFGTGSPDGSDGEIRPGTGNLSSALSLLASAWISYRNP